MKQYLVMCIGCLHCEVGSAVVLVTADEALAKATAERLNKDDRFSWRDDGQNEYEVFELPEPETVADEFRDEAPRP